MFLYRGRRGGGVIVDDLSVNQTIISWTKIVNYFFLLFFIWPRDIERGKMWFNSPETCHFLFLSFNFIIDFNLFFIVFNNHLFPTFNNLFLFFFILELNYIDCNKHFNYYINFHFKHMKNNICIYHFYSIFFNKYIICYFIFKIK